MNLLKILLIALFIAPSLYGQTINTSVPRNIDKAGRYMFYLHGRIVEEQGANAVHPVFGEYKYLDILDSLKKYKFHVISEVRPKNTNEILYAEKVVKQIDTLIKAGVSPKNIFIFGASKGAFITLWVSAKANNNKLNFVVMGICSEEITKEFGSQIICGNFLSIHESSDDFATSCVGLLENRKCVTGFQEVKLTLNNKHGFLYKPYNEWMIPLMNWANKKR